jgi:hypothetical protein
MPSYVIYGGTALCILVMAISGYSIVSKHWNGPLLLFVVGCLCVVGSGIWFYWQSNQVAENEAPQRGEAIAHLTALGWTVQPNPDGLQFMMSNRPLPPMEESAKYFRQINEPFSLAIQMVNDLAGLHYLSDVADCTKITISAGEFTDFSELRDFSHLTQLSISQVPLNGNGIVDISPLGSLTNLRELGLSMVRTKSIVALASLKNVTRLSLGGTLISNISPLSSLASLEVLEIRDTRVADLHPISNAQHLKEITVSGTQLPGLSVLAPLPNLKKLTIVEQQHIDLTSVGLLTNLETLSIVGGALPIDVLPLRNLKNLQSLMITGFSFVAYTAVPNLQVVGELTELRTLALGYVYVTDISFISNLRRLEEVSFNRMPISSIASLAGIVSIKKVTLADVPVTDISPLLTLPALADLTIRRTPARSDVLSELGRRGVKVNSW